MHSSRRNPGLTPLAIVLPHPQLTHRRSSLLSINSAASPHTPRSCNSPALPVYYQPPANRNSTDSWNSSNADDMDVEWKQEHVLLLSRTLDALPAHLVTPFNGSIPPSNLLDKIARGVSNAKGPAEWPYSIRATRAKLLELARSRAKEEAIAEQRRHAIAEEVEINDDSNYSYFHNGEEKPLTGVGIGPRRPLYRQSSMDFIKPTPSEIRDNPAIAKLSNRLQRTDRIIPNPSYHPYSRILRSQTNRRSSSPPHSNDVPALINQSSTPSSTTLDSFSSLSSAPRILRRSASTLSSGSLFSTSSGGMPLPDPRIQRVRRSDSFCSGPPAPPPKDTPVPPRAGFKRAPSYGALAQEARQDAVATDRVHVRKLSGSYPSSDEEEKARTTRAKKAKTKTSAAAVAVPLTPSVRSPPSSAPPSPAGPGTAPSSPIASRTPTGSSKPKSSIPKPRLKGVAALPKGEEVGSNAKSPKSLASNKPSSNKADGSVSKSKTSKTSKTDKEKDNHKDKAAKDKDRPRARPLPMNLQRNPSMFGAELPQLPLRATQNNTGSKSARPGPSLPSSPPSSYIQRSGDNGTMTPSKIRSPSPAIHALAPAASLSAHALAPAPVLGPALDKGVGARCAYNSHVTQATTATALMASPTLSPGSMTLSLSPEISPKVRTLRRVRRLAPGGRRISFGSLAAPGEEGDADMGGLDDGARSPVGKGLLGSAFQLH